MFSDKNFISLVGFIYLLKASIYCNFINRTMITLNNMRVISNKNNYLGLGSGLSHISRYSALLLYSLIVPLMI